MTQRGKGKIGAHNELNELAFVGRKNFKTFATFAEK
jgi:hypothetical protein